MLFHPLSIAFSVAASALVLILTVAGLGAFALAFVQGAGWSGGATTGDRCAGRPRRLLPRSPRPERRLPPRLRGLRDRPSGLREPRPTARPTRRSGGGRVDHRFTAGAAANSRAGVERGLRATAVRLPSPVRFAVIPKR